MGAKNISETLRIEQKLKSLGDRTTCRQCIANSKRTGNQCRAPATKGKSKYRFHGGASTGPKTPEGRLRCAEAKPFTAMNRAKRDMIGQELCVGSGYWRT